MDRFNGNARGTMVLTPGVASAAPSHFKPLWGSLAPLLRFVTGSRGCHGSMFDMSWYHGGVVIHYHSWLYIPCVFCGGDDGDGGV